MKVNIEIDDREVQVNPGDYSASELKKVLGVDPAKVIDQIEDGALKEIGEGDKVQIIDRPESEQKFISHEPAGQYS